MTKSIFDSITQAQETMIDYPNKIAYQLFVKDCNLDCNYCYNIHRFDDGFESVDVDEVIQIVKDHPRFYQGFVISGGEPTVYPDLPILIQKLKQETNLPVHIYTNGSNYSRLVDADNISIDYKWPLEDYLKYTRHHVPNDLVDIISTISPSYGIIRTTITSLHHGLAEKMEKELLALRDGNSNFIWNVQNYYDCQFVNRRDEIMNIPNYSQIFNETIIEFYKITSKYKGSPRT